MSESTIGQIVGLVEINTDSVGLFSQAGLDGVYVTLTNLDGSAVLDSNGDVVAPAETDLIAGIISGEFTFNDIPYGTYALELSPNATLASSIVGRDIFVLDAASENSINSGNFTEYPIIDVAAFYSQPTNTAGAISGFVYADTNGNGVQDAGENAAPGQEIELINGGGTVVEVTTSASDGSFSFSGLTTGDYTIDDLSAVLSQQPTGGIVDITDANETVSGVTLGAHLVSITGFAFNDVNGDGVQDDGKTAFANQTVELMNSSGVAVATAHTDSAGDFSFDGVNPGTYTFSAAGGGVDGGNFGDIITVGDNSINNVTLAAYDDAKISGFLFLDENNDGVFEVTPQGTDPDSLFVLTSAEIGVYNSQGSLVAEINASGDAFTFTADLAPGVYTLANGNVNGALAIASGGTAFSTFTVTAGETISQDEIGIYVPNSLSVPSIYIDTNFDGNDDGPEDYFTASSAEPVTLTLLNQDGSIAKNLDGVEQVLTLTSGVLEETSTSFDINGNIITQNTYAASFHDLAPGFYSVKVSAPGYQSEQADYQVGQSVDTGGLGSISEGEPDFTVQSIPLYKIGTGITISGTVFNDSNGDGTQDNGEQGIANDTVTLIKYINGLPVVETAVDTNANGQYSFSGLGAAPAGTYEIDFGTPLGYGATTPAFQVAVNGTNTTGAVAGPSAGFTLATTPPSTGLAAPGLLGSGTTLNIVLIGQSNAANFSGNSYTTLLEQDIEKELGFNGTTEVVNIIVAPGGLDSGSNNISGSPGTEFGGTGLTEDWLLANNGNEADGFSSGNNENGFYSDMNAVLTYLAQTLATDPGLASQPVAILDLHNEEDSQNAFLTTSIWMDALSFEASSIRAVLGQSAANTPYAFVNAIPFPEEPIATATQAQVDENEQAIRLGMESLSSDPAFNAFIAAQINDVDQNFQADGFGGWHLSSATTVNSAGQTVGAEFNTADHDLYDDYVLEQRLALSLSDEFSAYAQPGSPLANSIASTGTVFDDTGPLVTGAATVAGSPDELLLTVQQFDSLTSFTGSLSVDAANGVGWSIRSSATGSDSQLIATATSASIINSSEILLTFNAAVPAASSGDELFYAWGGERIAPAGTPSTGDSEDFNGTTYPGENAAIYDSHGEPIYTNAAGVLIGSSQETIANDFTAALGQTITSPTIVTGGTLELAVGSSISGNISFSGAGGELILDGTPPTNTIIGFAPGDTIKLAGVPFDANADSYTVATAGTLTVDAAGTIYNLDIAGVTVGQTGFVLNGDLGITALCYLRGTSILTPDGETKIETLNIGDEVITRFGGVQKIKWIGRQSYDPRFIANNPGKLPVRITKGALDGTLPKRDLYVSPGHSMLIGDTLVLASSLINGITIRQEKAATQIDYFQIEFWSHDCVLAEGAWSESFADAPGLRNQFHNQPEFWTLYPDYQTPGDLDLCAPRTQAGPTLEAALAPIVTHAATGIQLGPLEGSIDICTPHRLAGWARDLHNPRLPVWLDIIANDHIIGTILACDPRDDLAPLGLGNCAFAVTLTAPLSPQEMQTLRIRRAADDAEILTPLDRASRRYTA